MTRVRDKIEFIRRDTPTAAARDLGACVYVVHTPDDLIKIGFTADLDRRIHQLGCRWSDVLLAMPGTYADEQALHRRFAAHRSRGREYYTPHADIVGWVNAERGRIGISTVPVDGLG